MRLVFEPSFEWETIPGQCGAPRRADCGSEGGVAVFDESRRFRAGRSGWFPAFSQDVCI